MKNIFQKCKGDIGMAVPKTQQLGVGMAVCREDMLYKDYTRMYTYIFSFKVLFPVVS